MIGKKKKKDMEQDNEDLQNKQEVNPEGQNGRNAESEDQTVDDGQAPVDDNASPVAECIDKDKQITELNDKYLRLYAEFDNYRRRTLRERVELIQTASGDMMVALLPVLDDFNRAISAFDQISDVDALKEGLVLVQQKFKGILTQKGLEEMKSIGEVFDTDLHEAIANLPADFEENKNKVVDEIEKGYLLNGKVIRFAKVVVAN